MERSMEQSSHRLSNMACLSIAVKAYNLSIDRCEFKFADSELIESHFVYLCITLFQDV